jgi:V8-like Glu-specific endopeptidase
VGVVVAAVTPLRLRYDADTEAGSSGGLVLNQQLQPIALHHAGDPAAALRATYNQGIPLPLIRAALETQASVTPFWS